MKTRMSVSAARHIAVLAMIWIISLASPPRAGAADFVRGDVNGDGVVSMADGQTMFNYFYFGHTSPSPADCPAAWDSDGSGAIDASDPINLLNFVVLDGTPPPAPFPAAGRPNSGETCDSYGGGSPLPDPEAELKVLDAEVEGRTDGTAIIKVLYSGSTGPGGISGTIKDEAGVIFQKMSETATPYPLPCVMSPKSWVDELEGSFTLSAFYDKGFFKFGILPAKDPDSPLRLSAGKDVLLFTAPLCVVPGTPPGDYPLTLTTGELVDLDSGRAIVPRLVSGVLHVKSEVRGCRSGRCGPSYINFGLDGATGTPGGTVTVPFSITSYVPSQGFALSVDFDEEVLEAEPTVEKLWQRPDGSPYEFAVFEFNNLNKTPGNAGVDEGFIVGAATFSLTDTTAVIPPQTETAVLRFRFRVKPEAPVGSTTEVRFLDGGQGSGGPVENKLLSGGKFITPSSIDSFVFVNSRVQIVPDGTPFVRGDSNDDGTVNVSDPSFTLGYLFLGTTAPRCADAADANDDGRLDLTDPIATLSSLFLGDGALPAPYPAAGADPTGDALPCPPRP
jgi:hypothetical protein